METQILNQPTRKSFPITGMSCASCATSVESSLKSAPGVIDAGVNYANESAWAEFDDELTNLDQLQKVVQSIGYDLILDAEDPMQQQEEMQLKHYNEVKQRTLWASIFALPVFLIGMFFMNLPYGNLISMVLTAPVLFSFGRSFFSMHGSRPSTEKLIWTL